MRGDTAILRYAHEGWRFEQVSPAARLFWADLALHLNATGSQRLKVEHASDLDNLFERHRITQPYIEELVAHDLLIRSYDGCLVCPYLLQMQEKRQGGFHPNARRGRTTARRRAVDGAGQPLPDRRSKTSRLNGMKSKGRPRKSKPVSTQGHFKLAIQGGKAENLNNLKNAKLGYSGYGQNPELAENGEKLGFDNRLLGSLEESDKNIINNINNNSSLSSSEVQDTQKPKNLILYNDRAVHECTVHLLKAAKLEVNAKTISCSVAWVKKWLEIGADQTLLTKAIEQTLPGMESNGKPPKFSLKVFDKWVSTAWTELAVQKAYMEKKQHDKEQQEQDQNARYDMPAYRAAMARYKEETRKQTHELQYNGKYIRISPRPDIEQFRHVQVA